MKKTKLMAAIAAATMAAASMFAIPSFSASATTRIVYMLGDVNNDYVVDTSDTYYILEAMGSHGLADGSRVSVTYVQDHLSDWFPNAACAKAADADEDGYISFDDARDVLTYCGRVGAGYDGYKNIGNLYFYIP